MASAEFEVAAHLADYNVPLAQFVAANPELTHFVSGAWIFSTFLKSTTHDPTTPSNAHIHAPAELTSRTVLAVSSVPRTATTRAHGIATLNPSPADKHRVLLLQRSRSDSYPEFWEGPGGLVEPEKDATLLHGVAREVFEETGLRVSKFVDLVAVDEWVRVKPDGLAKVAKFSFLVEVSAACSFVGGGSGEMAPADDAAWKHHDLVNMDPNEHQDYQWVTEREVREGVEQLSGKYKFVDKQGRNCLKAFDMVKSLQRWP